MKFKKMYLFLILIGLLILSVVGFMNLPRFGRLPQGERLKRIEQSPNYRDGEFQNLTPTPQFASDKSRWRVMYDFLFEKRDRNRPNHAIPALKCDLKNLPIEKNLLVWFGHSSYYMQMDGKRLLVDPVFYDASPFSFFNKPFDGTDLYEAEDLPDIDYLIITHDHWDHLDHQVVTKLRGRIGKVICPLGVGEHFESWGYRADQLVELDWNEQSELDEQLEVYCLPSRHFSGRSLKSNQTLWASFLLKTATQTIYLSGDGGYDDRFKVISQKFPSIDYAIMENGQYNEDWRYIHLLPEDLVKAIKDINARRVLTGHHSKYALAKHPWDEPMEKITSMSEEYSIPLLTPTIGEVVYL